MTQMFCTACGSPADMRLVHERMRPVCMKCGQVMYLDPKLAVAVIVADGDLILLGRRGPGTRAPGKWSFPAGFVERGERVEDAAVRETREETGLDVSIGRLIGLFSSSGEPVALAVYAIDDFTGEARASDDLTDLGWFSLDALPDLAFPRDRSILDAWMALSAKGNQASS